MSFWVIIFVCVIFFGCIVYGLWQSARSAHDEHDDAALASDWKRWHQLPTSVLFSACKNTLPGCELRSDISRLTCCHLLLSRPDVSVEQQSITQLIYNTSLTNILRNLDQQGVGVHQLCSELSLEITLEPDDNGQSFDHFTLVDDIQTSDLRLQQVYHPGLGVAVVGERPNLGKEPDQYYPPEGIFRPFTFTLKHITTASHNKMRLVISGKLMRQPDKILLAKQQYPLTYSPGSALLLLLNNATIDRLERVGLFEASKAEHWFGIYAIESLVDHKIPILLIHGLQSSPLIWRYISMAIINNPVLHEKYQLFHAFYPSGPPPLYNAMRLRKKLDQLQTHFKNHSVAQQNLVVIGHSLGGIIANTFVVNTQYRIWDRVFVARPQELFAAQDADQTIEDLFIFSAHQHVKLVFFIDTPHCGSLAARSLVGRIGAALVTLPDDFTNIFKSLIGKIGIDKITPQMRSQLEKYGPNSIEVMYPGHPLLTELNKLPIEVPAFSIIGSASVTQHIDKSDCETINDGIVPYLSAHIEQAEDELIVSSSHDSYQHPKTIAFIMNKLNELTAKQ